MPSNAKLLPYRSNIPYLSDYCLTPCDPEFPSKGAKENNGGIIMEDIIMVKVLVGNMQQ